jgi:hypothetical protein
MGKKVLCMQLLEKRLLCVPLKKDNPRFPSRSDVEKNDG